MIDSETQKTRHTILSYIAGFILSLVFTVVPYYLVINKHIAGQGLLLAVLGAAFLQMCVQIFFFLHLGRGPKPLYNVVFFVATVGIIVVAVGGSLLIMSNLYSNMSPAQTTKKLAQDEGIAQIGGQKTGACQGVKDNHKVVISGGKINPTYTKAHRCDTLTFINEDNQQRLIAFGAHPNHAAYGGQEEELVRKGYPKTITLNETGDYTFHDHLNPAVSGSFSVGF